jgi:RND family efflux transporter MFP subunit
MIEWDEYQGYLEAVESVDVRARVSGLVVATPFQEGANVSKDDLLVELDVRPFQAELESRLADEARATAQVDLARIELDRISSIAPAARTATEYDAAAATLRQAQAVLAGATAQVAAARLNVEWCRVTAPIAGRISRKNVTPGNLITGGGAQATLLTTITSIDPIYCYTDADERSVLKYQQLAREGRRISARHARIPCFLQLENEVGFPHQGEIDFVDNRLDRATGTIRARGVFPNPDGWMIPGFFGRVRVPGSGRYQALLVPDAAVAADQNERLVLIAGAGDKVERRSVKLGALFGELRAIESGLSGDERVIVNGLLHARPGVKVRPQAAEISADAYRATAAGSPATQAIPLTRDLRERDLGMPGPASEDTPATRPDQTRTPDSSPSGSRP